MMNSKRIKALEERVEDLECKTIISAPGTLSSWPRRLYVNAALSLVLDYLDLEYVVEPKKRFFQKKESKKKGV